MDEGLPSVSILAFFVILLINVFVHGFGMAMDHASKEEIDKKSEDNKEGISRKLVDILDQRDRFLNPCRFLR